MKKQNRTEQNRTEQNRTEQNRMHFIDTFCGVVSFGRMYTGRNVSFL